MFFPWPRWRLGTSSRASLTPLCVGVSTTDGTEGRLPSGGPSLPVHLETELPCPYHAYLGYRRPPPCPENCPWTCLGPHRRRSLWISLRTTRDIHRDLRRCGPR